jgi:hypothetical protein
MAVVWALRSRVALLNMPHLGIMESDTNLKYLQRICNFDQAVIRSMYLEFFRAHEMPYNCKNLSAIRPLGCYVCGSIYSEYINMV